MSRTWVTWNVRGLGRSLKRKVVKQAVSKLRPEVLLIQESKLNSDREREIQEWSGSLDMEFETVFAIGAAGGLLTLWKRNSFVVTGVVKRQRFIILQVHSSQIDCPLWIVNVYGPNIDEERRDFFMDLGSELCNFAGALIVGDDFNATLTDDERRGQDNSNRAADSSFKFFVDSLDLIDLNMENGTFTWNSSRSDGPRSKLDRWLLNDEAILRFDGASQSAEDWGISDHRAITLRLGSTDFGPKPFCFYNSWLMEEGFKEMVEEWWCSAVVEGWSGFVLMKKLKGLRDKIREWKKARGVWGSVKIHELEDRLNAVMGRMENEGNSIDLRKHRLEILNQLWREYRLEES
ncbi:uncharacterized protein LOC130724947 [Lotus japonicus]|uniref:uncharacterized protein LOC130724947 n=1 Tax=Lotus japonicus TaxID=34305 RepID=UPI0025827CFC|nr:uncharacterized protein LOC130724947 [Lotus japonicus]